LAKPEWELKRMCLGCGARFYDMTRDPIVCPKCEAVFDPLALLKPRRSRAAASTAAAAAAATEAAAEKVAAEKAAAEKADPADGAAAGETTNDDLLIEGEDGDSDLDDDDDDTLIEDASELGEDDDVSEVIEGVEPAKSEEP